MIHVRHGLFAFALSFISITAVAEPIKRGLMFPDGSTEFFVLNETQRLDSLVVSGKNLYLVQGSDNVFGSTQTQNYYELKRRSQTEENFPVQWALVNLKTGRIVEQSLQPEKVFFGASVSKIFVAATLLEKQNGILNDRQLQLMAEMLAVSSNAAWSALQIEIGDGSDYLGQKRIHQFTQKMGYLRTHGFKGWMDRVHGNELNVQELIWFLRDIYNNKFKGANVLWKFLFTCRTASAKGNKYFPKSYIGGKTGTYWGPTVDPDTGADTTVNVQNHAMVFELDGQPYGLSVLSNRGKSEDVALIVGGLVRGL